MHPWTNWMDFSADVVAETAKQENSEDGLGDDAKSIAWHTLYVNNCFYLRLTWNVTVTQARPKKQWLKALINMKMTTMHPWLNIHSSILQPLQTVYRQQQWQVATSSLDQTTVYTHTEPYSQLRVCICLVCLVLVCRRKLREPRTHTHTHTENLQTQQQPTTFSLWSNGANTAPPCHQSSASHHIKYNIPGKKNNNKKKLGAI